MNCHFSFVKKLFGLIKGPKGLNLIIVLWLFGLMNVDHAASVSLLISATHDGAKSPFGKGITNAYSLNVRS